MTATAHISDLTLDALALGALDSDSETRVREHLAGCTLCRGAQTRAAELRSYFMSHILPRGLPGGVRSPAKQRAWWAWLVAPALVAAGLLWMLRRPPDPGDLAIKGKPGWQVFAHRDGQTFTVHDGMRLAAGDRLRFSIPAAGARYVLITSIDGAGVATTYYPYGGAESAAIEGDRIEPAGSIVLDAAPGPERIFAILSDRPIAAELVAIQLRAIALGGPAAIRALDTLPIAARAQISVVFEKEAP